MKENGSEKYPAEAGGGEQKDTGFTCREVYEEGAALLQDLEDGRLDARLLLEHYCGIPAHRLLADPETAVEPKARDAFMEAVHKRAAREPLAYIIGEQSFMGLPFVVSPDVLIPEQDTENLVEEALRYLEDGSRILDLCTGSGCILRTFPNLHCGSPGKMPVHLDLRTAFYGSGGTCSMHLAAADPERKMMQSRRRTCSKGL